MAIPTTTEQLELVHAARLKILTGGQAYTADGRQMTRADLRALNEEIARLEGVLRTETRAASGGMFGYVVPLDC